MDIKKYVDVDVQDTNVNLYVPLLKVDAEKRLVSGFATLDNVDKQGHVVDFDGSVDAFATWRRNIREMHGNDPVGKAVDIEARPYYDPESDRMYNGIYITVYVSKTAETAWTRVLEGIYTGFSIGGRILEKDEGYDAERDEWYTLIKKYELVEVSLVDSPANPLANIYSVQKADSGLRMTVDGKETKIFKTQNVMFCNACKCASFDSDSCPSCNGVVKSIGWVEDTSDKKDEVKKMLTGIMAEKPNDQGGVIVTKNDETVETPAEEVVEEAPVEEATEATETEEAVATEEVVETADTVVEEDVVPAEEAPETVEASDSVDVDALVEKVAARVAEMLKADETEAVVEEAPATEENPEAPAEDAVAKALEAIGGQLAEFGKTIEGLGERVETIESTTASKKSKDITKSDDVEDESFWRGSFLN